MQGVGQTLNGFSRKTGLRNRRYRRDSEYHHAPRCPWRDTPRGGGGSLSQGRDRSYRPPYSSISMETPVFPHKAESAGETETGDATADAGDVFMAPQADSMVALDTGAAANLVCLSWLARHNRSLERREIPREPAHPSKARFRFRDGRHWEVRHAAGAPVGVAGNKGMFTAFALAAEIPALLRKGAMEDVGGQLDFLRGSFHLRRQWSADSPEGESGGTLYLERGRFPGGPIEECVEMPGGLGFVRYAGC